jgi:hypothetical protein
MPRITKRALGYLLFAGTLICFAYVAAQQSPSLRSERTQSVKPQSTQARMTSFAINWCNYKSKSRICRPQSTI